MFALLYRYDTEHQIIVVYERDELLLSLRKLGCQSQDEILHLDLKLAQNGDQFRVGQHLVDRQEARQKLRIPSGYLC